MQAIIDAKVGLSGRVMVNCKANFVVNMAYVEFLAANNIESTLKALLAWALLRTVNINSGTMPAGDLAPVEQVFDDAYVGSVLAQGPYWVTQLVACQQVTAMSESNFENYFRSMGTETVPWRVDSIINYLSTNLDLVKLLPDYELLVAESPFVTYHTTASSTPGLVRRAIECCPLSFPMSFDELDAYTQAVNDITSLELSRAISERVLRFTSAVLEAAGCLPDKWYMGKRAVAAGSPASHSALVTVMKRAFKVRSNIGDIETVTDINALQTMMNTINNTAETDVDAGAAQVNGGADEDDGN